MLLKFGWRSEKRPKQEKAATVDPAVAVSESNAITVEPVMRSRIDWYDSVMKSQHSSLSSWRFQRKDMKTLYARVCVCIARPRNFCIGQQ